MSVSPHVALVVGVFAITWAAVLIRWAAAPTLTIAFYRLAFAGLILIVWCGLSRAPFWRAWRGVDWLTGLGSALLLALHFAFWIASLNYTSVAASAVLVSTQPVFVALLGWIVLKERPGRRAWLGILLALAGSIIIAGNDLATNRRALVGDALAVMGAVWISGYYVIARYLRKTKDLVPYVTVIYLMAAVWLALAVLSKGDPLVGFSISTWGAILLLALVPTIIGHSAMNYALRYLRAYEVNVAILAEPIGATLLAALLLAEFPVSGTIWGGLVVLAGILLTLSRRPVVDEVAAANL